MLFILGVTFTILISFFKLIGFVQWDWWTVTAPIWGTVSLVLLCLVTYGLFYLLVLSGRKQQQIDLNQETSLSRFTLWLFTPFRSVGYIGKLLIVLWLGFIFSKLLGWDASWYIVMAPVWIPVLLGLLFLVSGGLVFILFVGIV